MSARDVAEATAVLGRAVVVEAMADPGRAADLFTKHAGAVREAVAGIRSRRLDVAEARAYAEALPHEVKVALAGAWAGDAGERAVEGTGLYGCNDPDVPDTTKRAGNGREESE